MFGRWVNVWNVYGGIHRVYLALESFLAQFIYLKTDAHSQKLILKNVQSGTSGVFKLPGRLIIF